MCRVDPVRELISSELLAEGPQSLSFSHDLNREAVRASLPSSAVQALDRQVASALLEAGALPVEVATQLAASAVPGDQVAITTLMKASDSLAGTDPGQAADLAHRALDLTPAHHPLRGPLVARIAILPCTRQGRSRRPGPPPTGRCARPCRPGRRPRSALPSPASSPSPRR